MVDRGLRIINENRLGISLSLADGQKLPIEWDAKPPGIENSEKMTELDLPGTVLSQLESTYLVFKTSVSRRFHFGAFITDDNIMNNGVSKCESSMKEKRTKGSCVG